MIFNLINAFIFIIFLILLLEYKVIKGNMTYILFALIVLGSILNFNLVWESDLFDLSNWKTIFIFLIFISFLVILGLIEESNFDIYCLFVLVLVGSLVLVICDNLITLYLGLELQTFSIFILIAKNRNSIISSEAGLKYFILGVLSSSFYLLGVAILFIFGFNLNLKELVILSNDIIVLLSLSIITLSFCFKLSLFPLHFWIPDIYEGSSWDIISLISTLPKISIICVIVQILSHSNILLGFSLLSIIIGTIGALNQSKMKRLLAYSGISHVGFIILGYTILNNESYVVSSIYLLIYILSMLSIFIIITRFNFNNRYIIELGSLKFKSKIYAVTLSLLILSIAGIPPLSGFISKWFIVLMTVEFNYNFSTFILILFSIIGAGYYLRIVKIIYFQKKSSYFLWEDILEINKTSNEIILLNLGLFLFITLFLIINFSFVINLISFYFYYWF